MNENELIYLFVCFKYIISNFYPQIVTIWSDNIIEILFTKKNILIDFFLLLILYFKHESSGNII